MSHLPAPDSASLPIDAETHRRIESYARAVGLSPSEVVSRAFDEYEANHNGLHPTARANDTVFDLVNRAGLIGCLKANADTPTDLGTNPAHMDGFGLD